VFLSA